MRFLPLVFLGLLIGCMDLNDQDEIKIGKDIYALHFAGIDGYSIVRKVSASGFVPIVDPLVVTIHHDDYFTNILLKRVDSLNSIDTMYLQYSFSSGQLDTISIADFYNQVGRYENVKILLPPKDSVFVK